jgi:hypothetical protein
MAPAQSPTPTRYCPSGTSPASPSSGGRGANSTMTGPAFRGIQTMTAPQPVRQSEADSLAWRIPEAEWHEEAVAIFEAMRGVEMDLLGLDWAEEVEKAIAAR